MLGVLEKKRRAVTDEIQELNKKKLCPQKDAEVLTTAANEFSEHTLELLA